MSVRATARAAAPSRAIVVPRPTNHVIRTLKDAGHDAFAVGGALRDILAVSGDADEAGGSLGEGAGGRVCHLEWDVATAARPPQVQALFGRTVPTGIDHGTVTVLVEGDRVEVTTFRADLETDGRRARVRFSDDLLEDLARRDFTINALAYDPDAGRLIDPYGGVADLAARVLRPVGDPVRRFEEDYLRILRGARFAARFDLAVGDDVRQAMREGAPGTRRLSGERVRDELRKTLAQAERPSTALRLLHETGVLAELLPEIEACFGVAQNRWHADDVAEHTLHVVDEVPRTAPFLRLVALLHDIGKPGCKVWEPARDDFVFRGHAELGARLAAGVLERLRFPRREIERVTHLVGVHMDLFPAEAGDAAVRRWLRRVGPGNVDDLFTLHYADWRGNLAKTEPPLALEALHARAGAVLAEGRALELADLAIDGDDLRAMGLPPGPRYSEILNGLLQRVVEDPSLNERERLLGEARLLVETRGA